MCYFNFKLIIIHLTVLSWLTYAYTNIDLNDYIENLDNNILYYTHAHMYIYIYMYTYIQLAQMSSWNPISKCDAISHDNMQQPHDSFKNHENSKSAYAISKAMTYTQHENTT